MKTMFLFVLVLVSLQANAMIESQRCPEAFSISYYDISKSPLTPTIKNDRLLKKVWDSVKATQKLVQEFRILTRSSSALCAYTSGKAVAFLQTRNGFDELVVPFSQNLYFRTKVLSFELDYIELAVDDESKKLQTPVFQIDTNGRPTMIGETEVGTAEAVNVQVLE